MLADLGKGSDRAVEVLGGVGSRDLRPNPGLPLGDALRLGRDALQMAENGSPELAPESLEACLLESSQRRGRKFRRLSADDVRGLLGA